MPEKIEHTPKMRISEVTAMLEEIKTIVDSFEFLMIFVSFPKCLTSIIAVSALLSSEEKGQLRIVIELQTKMLACFSVVNGKKLEGRAAEVKSL